MPSPLDGKNILLGVTGSIACYKAADLASKLVQAGAQVDVILTRGAVQFITPLTFRSLTHRPVLTDLFDPSSDAPLVHIDLARRADLLVIAPATANVLAKMAWGLADDTLTTILLASRAPVLVAPAMDAGMFEHPTVQENLERLRERGIHVVGPERGRLASGLLGWGRMTEPEVLLEHCRWLLGRDGDLAGSSLVVSAGGTREPLDPIRVFTNRSSGRMGYALAEAARDRGARVTLVSAPTSLPDPVGVEVVRVGTALEMAEAVQEACRGADAVLMAAAVADYRPASPASRKVKKGPEEWTVSLVRNPDILAGLPEGLVKVGFAAETEDLLENARAKLRSKGLHLVVANDASAFGAEESRAVLLDRDGGVEELPLLPKYEVAWRILDRVVEYLTEKRPG